MGRIAYTVLASLCAVTANPDPALVVSCVAGLGARVSSVFGRDLAHVLPQSFLSLPWAVAVVSYPHKGSALLLLDLAAFHRQPA